jgi:hypothetical protein
MGGAAFLKYRSKRSRVSNSSGAGSEIAPDTFKPDSGEVLK